MKRSSAILLWAAVVIALLCTLASVVSSFYLAYGYTDMSDMTQDIARLQASPRTPASDRMLIDFRSGAVLHLSPVGPLIFTLAPLCWLYVFLKDRPALASKDGRISTWIVLICLLVFLGSLVSLHEVMKGA